MVASSVEICCLAITIKDQEMNQRGCPRKWKKSNTKVDTSVCSKVKRKQSAYKNLKKKSRCLFKESGAESEIGKTRDSISTLSTPSISYSLRSSSVRNKNTPNKISAQKRTKEKTDKRYELNLSRIENKSEVSTYGINLRSRLSTPLKENSKDLKETGMSHKQSHRSRTLINESTNCLSKKRGRKPLKCKKNIMSQNNCGQNLEESCLEEDVLSKKSLGSLTSTLPVTSTPLVTCKGKAKTFKNLHKHPKCTAIKKRCRNVIDSFEIPKETVHSSQHDLILRRQHSASSEKSYNLRTPTKTNIKYKQKSSNKKSSKINKAHTYTEVPIDDLSLTKFVEKRKVKSDGFKAPSKNSLKRKRYVFNEFHKANEGYEDDIYEAETFDWCKDLQDTSFSDISSSMPTPKFGVMVTPRIFPKTPVYRDCISPAEYAKCRKVAEECMYRKRKKKSISSEETSAPEKKNLELSQVLESVQRQEKFIENLIQEARSDKENSYLSN